MIEIILSEQERGVIRQALVESFMGYAGRFLPGFLGVKVARLKELLAVFVEIGEGEQSIPYYTGRCRANKTALR